jgi:hypothetical protein
MLPHRLKQACMPLGRRTYGPIRLSTSGYSTSCAVQATSCNSMYAYKAPLGALKSGGLLWWHTVQHMCHLSCWSLAKRLVRHPLNWTGRLLEPLPYCKPIAV